MEPLVSVVRSADNAEKYIFEAKEFLKSLGF